MIAQKLEAGDSHYHFYRRAEHVLCQRRRRCLTGGFSTFPARDFSTAVVMTIRIICLIAGTSLLTYTTSPITLTDGLERLMKPLKKAPFSSA